MSTVSRKIGVSALVAGVSILTAASGVNAADMPMPMPPPIAADNQTMEFGTGWYLRGDVGIADEAAMSVGGKKIPKGDSFPNSWAIGGGFGYKYNDWIRTDATLDWRAPRNFDGNTASISCVTGAYLDNAGNKQNYHSTCKDWTRARVNNLTLMFNLYADLGTWWGVTPYVGAGVGVNFSYQKTSQTWTMSNGNHYDVIFSDPVNTSLTWQYKMDQARSTNNTHFAWAVMGGFGYSVTSNTMIDIGYRYLDLGQNQSLSNPGEPIRRMKVQEVRFGVRYTPDF